MYSPVILFLSAVSIFKVSKKVKKRKEERERRKEGEDTKASSVYLTTI